jgi:hypothetical protein
MVSQIYALASQHREGICWCTKICTSMRIQVNTMPKNAMEDKIHNACSWIMYVHACLTCKNSHAFAFPSLSVQEMQFRMSMELRCKDFRTMKETKKRTGVTAMVWEPESPSSSAAEIRRTISLQPSAVTHSNIVNMLVEKNPKVSGDTSPNRLTPMTA